MKKIIQKITKLVALSAWLVGHYPALATAPRVNQEQQGGFFDTNEECPWHVGVKGWSKIPIRINSEYITMGYREYVIGPFVEWKPLNGIGVQAGVAYNDNSEIRIKIHSINNDPELGLLDVNSVKFHGISIPLSIRWYPGNDRQFALHIGPRFMIPLGKGKQVSHGPISKDKVVKLHIIANYERGNDLEMPSYVIFDFGFAYNTKCGCIIGMQGLGIALGYDFTRLLIKA